jgi:lysophospholipid acyltransferase (LPLAT)-like uncharacterized protein
VTSPAGDRPLARAVALLGGAYLRFVGFTSRLRVHHHPAAHEIVRGNKPCVFAFWHRYQLMMCYEHRGRGVHVIVSRSKDGELIARALEDFGYVTARGSSTRGGASAFMALLEAVQAGGQAAVTPDGPKGPFRSVQPGVLALAQKAGVPVVPCGWAGTRVRRLPSWDHFLVPLPFGRYQFVFGEPVPVLPGDSAAESNVRAALDAAAAHADALLHA